jgi:hypothetical protein
MSFLQDTLIWENKNFPNKTTENEDIILLVREDIVIIILKAIGLYFIFFLLLLFRLIFSSFTDFIWLSAYDAFMYSAGLFLTLIFLMIFHNYYLSLQIITSERIIDVNQRSLFRREISSTAIAKIQDVTFKKVNFFNFIFNYGNVILQTSGNAGSDTPEGINGFVFENVPNPSEIAHLIDLIQQKEQTESIQRNAIIEAEALQKVLSRKILN